MKPVVIYIAELNGKAYVGQTPRFAARRREHISDARNCGGKKCPKFAAAIRKHGAENILWRVLAMVDKAIADETERRAIRHFRTRDPDGYNLADGGGAGFAGNRAGKKQSAAHIAKRVESMRRTRWTAEGRAAQAAMMNNGLSAKMTRAKYGGRA